MTARTAKSLFDDAGEGVVRFPGDAGAQFNNYENFYWSDETVGVLPAPVLGQEFATSVSSAASTDAESVKESATVTLTHYRWVDNGGTDPVAIVTDASYGQSVEEPAEPFQVSGNGNTAAGNQNQLVTSFTVPKTGQYLTTTNLFHSYSASFTSRTSHGLAIVKSGDSVTVAANRIVYQYWQQDNVNTNTRYDLVSSGFVSAASTNPHALVTLDARETYQLWRISNTGTFRDGDSIAITLAQQAQPSVAIIDDVASGYMDIGKVRMQWGIAEGAGVTFPVSFKTNTIPSVTPVALSNGDNQNVTLQTVSHLGFNTWVVRNENDVGIGTPIIHWTAFGEKP